MIFPKVCRFGRSRMPVRSTGGNGVWPVRPGGFRNHGAIGDRSCQGGSSPSQGQGGPSQGEQEPGEKSCGVGPRGPGEKSCGVGPRGPGEKSCGVGPRPDHVAARGVERSGCRARRCQNPWLQKSTNPRHKKRGETRRGARQKRGERRGRRPSTQQPWLRSRSAVAAHDRRRSQQSACLGHENDRKSSCFPRGQPPERGGGGQKNYCRPWRR